MAVVDSTTHERDAVSVQDRVVVTLVAVLALACAIHGLARAELSPTIRPAGLTIGDHPSQVCARVTVRNPGEASVVLDHWQFRAGERDWRVADAVAVAGSRTGAGSVCFEGVDDCGLAGRIELRSVEVASTVSDIPSGLRLDWRAPCKGWVRRSADERGWALAALAARAHAVEIAKPVTRFLRGEAGELPTLAQLRDAAERARPVSTELATLVVTRDLDLGLPELDVIQALVGTRAVAEGATVAGWIAIADDQFDAGLNDLSQAARLGAAIAAATSWQGRAPLRAMKGAGIARTASRGLVCLVTSVPDDEDRLRSIATRLAAERAWRGDAFDPELAVASERADAERVWARARVMPTFEVAKLALDSLGIIGETSWLSGTLTKTRSAEASLLAPEVAIAVRRYRLANGAPPPTLLALVPAWLARVPADPTRADGAPLGYRASGDGSFVVWSAGIDGRDDGGDAEKDLVVAVPARPAPCDALSRLAAPAS